MLSAYQLLFDGLAYLPYLLSTNHKNIHPCINYCLEENMEVENFSNFKEF